MKTRSFSSHRSHVLAEPLGVRVALEVIPNELSRAGSLVHFIEEVLDASEVGICLDFGHAHMDGDLVEAIETVSEHLITTHVHDNRGRTAPAQRQAQREASAERRRRNARLSRTRAKRASYLQECDANMFGTVTVH